LVYFFDMKKLYEFLVPTIYGDTMKPIRTRHHKRWDEFVRKLSGGLTLMTPAKGQWVFENNLFEERVIPVRILCTDSDMKKIVEFSLKHYRQKAVMYYVLSTECHVVYAS
jgi:hypothetical protein